MQQLETIRATRGLSSSVWASIAVVALVAISVMFGMASAWADDEGEPEFSDSVSDVSDQATDEGQKGAANAEGQDDEAKVSGPAFDKKEMKVKLGSAHLVGFAPEAADDESDDEARAEWHKNWKEAVEEAKVDLTDESGWLVAEDADGNPISYDAITGIVVEDKEVFELLGEFPDWKVDDEGVEYRWWYGLLGVAKKAGDTKLQIVYRDDEGVNQVLAECAVHVVDPDEEADSSPTATQDTQVDETSENVENSDASEPEGGADAEDDTGAAAADDSAGMKSQSSTSVSISTTATDSTQSADGSQSTDSTSGTSSNTSTSGSDSSVSKTDSTSSAYPKEMFKTLQGSTISASLLANDSASEEALNKLANGATLHLAVETKSKLGDEAEKSLTTVSSNNGVTVAERLSVKLLDANNSEATISGMNLTVKIVADNAMKALDATSVQVWYVAEDGTTEKLNAKLSGGYLTFDTKHLSDFAVMGKTAGSSGSSTTSGKSGLPQTGDPMAYVAIVLAFVAGFAASSALNARRRLRE